MIRRKGIAILGSTVFIISSWTNGLGEVRTSTWPDRPNAVTADHKKFDALKKDFKSGPEVTRACLTCHTEAARQVQSDIHWRWSWDGDGSREVGKKNVINNF